MSEQALPIAEAVRTPGGSDVPSLAFADTDGAAKFLKSLVLLPVPQAYEALMGQLRALAVANFTPRERGTIAEHARTQAAHLHSELARRYAGKPQPFSEREEEAADQAVAMWQVLWEQYSACLKPLLEGDPDLQGVKAKLLQRGLFVGKQLVLTHGLARRTMPASVWQELHAYYRLAEMLDCAVTAVSDDLMPHAVGISCYSTYSHALLLGLADPCALSIRQIELTDRWLGQWARKMFPYAQQRETEGAVLLVDLDSAEGASVAAVAPRGASPAIRFGYPGKLATSVRGRLKRLSAGGTPAELQLGHDVSAEQSAALLAHLDQRWCHPPKRNLQGHADRLALAAGGLPAAYFRVGGRTFDRQDPLGRLTFQGAQHLQTLGALTDYDRNKEEAERNWPWERWQGAHERNECALARRDAGHYRWFYDQLVVVRDDERMQLGHVTRVGRGSGAEVALVLRLWPGAPRTLAMRSLSTAFNEEPPMPTLLLAETPEEPATLIVGPRVFTAGRVLRSLDPGPERKLRLTRLVQRGADFERVAFEETA
jgi:cyclic-di-GMP-binding protein